MASKVTAGTGKASRDQVSIHAAGIRQLAETLGLTDIRVRNDGTVVAHSSEPGYRAVTRLSALASELVGEYVHVISDDAPGAVDAQEL